MVQRWRLPVDVKDTAHIPKIKIQSLSLCISHLLHSHWKHWNIQCLVMWSQMMWKKKFLKIAALLVWPFRWLFSDDLGPVLYMHFSPMYFTLLVGSKQSEIHPPSPTLYLNPEDSNLINGTLTDYDDVSGHFAKGIIFFAHTMALHMNPAQICFGSAQMNVKAWTFDWSIRLYNRQWVSIWERTSVMWTGVSVRTSTLWWWMGGHKLMSLTCCTYLFLCVTMSHYAPMGIKHPHWYQEIHYVVEQKARYMMPQLIWVETLLLAWGLLLTNTQGT